MSNAFESSSERIREWIETFGNTKQLQKLFNIKYCNPYLQKLVRLYTEPNIEFCLKSIYPPASEASREVANVTERKNPHTPEYGVKEFE